MKLKSKILTVALLASVSCLLATTPASAQQYGPVGLSVSNSLPGYGTNSLQNGLVTLTKFDEVALVATGKLSGAGTATISLTGYASVDGVNVATDTALVNWTIPAQGTLTFVSVTNISRTVIGSIGYLKFTTLANGNSTILSNFGVAAYPKPVRTGN